MVSSLSSSILTYPLLVSSWPNPIHTVVSSFLCSRNCSISFDRQLLFSREFPQPSVKSWITFLYHLSYPLVFSVARYHTNCIEQSVLASSGLAQCHVPVKQQLKPLYFKLMEVPVSSWRCVLPGVVCLSDEGEWAAPTKTLLGAGLPALLGAHLWFV